MTAPSTPNRQSGPALRKPPADLSGFPTQVQNSKRGPIYRAFQIGREPVWFSANGAGRFDLTPPHGTMYVADDVSTAVRERLGEVAVTNQSVFRSVVEDMAVAQVGFGQHRCANLCDPASSRFGVTREFETMVPYELPQIWARAFFAAGYAGIRYGARFSPGPANAWALFGDAGGVATIRPTPDLDYVSACELAGLRIVDTPARSELTVIEPPIDDR